MNIKVTVPSSEIEKSCLEKLRRIKVAREEIRREVVEKLQAPVKWLWFTRRKARTPEEAEAIVRRYEQGGNRCAWQTAFEDVEDLVNVLLKIVRYTTSLELDWDTFVLAGLAGPMWYKAGQRMMGTYSIGAK